MLISQIITTHITEETMPKSVRKYNTWQEVVEAKSHYEGDCRIWDAGTHKQGYPMAKWDDKMHLVARKQMEHKLGRTLAKAERVKNSCGNELCVNPDHYYVAQPGTEEWKCVNFRYDDAKRREIFDDYMSLNGAWGSFGKICEKHKIARGTLWKIIKEYK